MSCWFELELGPKPIVKLYTSCRRKLPVEINGCRFVSNPEKLGPSLYCDMYELEPDFEWCYAECPFASLKCHRNSLCTVRHELINDALKLMYRGDGHADASFEFDNCKKVATCLYANTSSWQHVQSPCMWEDCTLSIRADRFEYSMIASKYTDICYEIPHQPKTTGAVVTVVALILILAIVAAYKRTIRLQIKHKTEK